MNLRTATFLVPAFALLAACNGDQENQVNAANIEEPVINEFVPTNEVDNLIDNNVVDNNMVDNNTVNAY